MIADTSFLVSLFIPEDTLHERALERLMDMQYITIPDRVLEETFTVLTYKRGIDYAIEILEKIEKNQNINIYRQNKEDWNSIKQLIKKIMKKISFTDYIVIYLSIKERKVPLCFDEDIIKITKKLIRK